MHACLNALFSLPWNLFCVNNVRRTYILINWLGLKGFKNNLRLEELRAI